nr:MAG TPA: minor tail protein [Caudoviricetes sp.]
MADGEVVIDTSLNTGGFEKGISALGGIASKGLTASTVAISAVSAALSTCAGYAIKVGSDFEAGMSNVEAISSASAQSVTTASGEMVDGLTALTEKAKEMGATTKFSATESSQALNYMAMAGWDAQAMYDGLAGIMTLAAASGEDLATTSDIVTDALTAFGMQASESGHFADVLAQVSASANTNVGLLGETFKYVAPLCGTMGYSAEDASIAIGLMANSGIKGSQAGTALKTAIANMAAPTKAMAAQMAALGIEITNSDGSSKSLMEVMQNLRTSFDGLSESEQAAAASTIFGKESMSGMLAVINASDEDFAKLTESIYNCDGAAEQMAATMQDNLQGQVTILKSGVEGLGIAVYEKLQEPLKNLAVKGQEYIGQLTDAFNSGGFSGLVSEIGNVLADAVSMVMTYAPKLVDAAVDCIDAFIGGISSALPAIAPAAVQIGTTLIEGIIKVVPQLLSAGVQLLTALVEGAASAAPQLIVAFVEAVAAVIEALIEQAPALLQAGMDLLQALADGILQSLPIIAEAAPELIQSLCDSVTETLPQLLETGLEIVNSLAEGLIQAAPQIATAAAQIITTLATFVIQNLPTIALAAVEIISTLADTLISSIPSLLKSVVDIMQGILGFVCDNLPTIAQAAVEILTTLCEKLVAIIPQLVPVVTQIIMSIFNFVVQNLPTIIQAAIQIMVTLVQGIIAQIPTLIPAVVQLISQIFQSIVANLPTIISGAIQIITTLAMGLIQAIPHVIAAIPQIVSAIINGFLNTNWASVGVNIIQGIGSGIASAAKGLVQIAVNAARNAIYAVKSWLGIASPSKRAKKEIGQWILPGVGEGVKESEPELNDRMEDAADHMVSAFNGHSRNIDVSGLVRKMQAGVEQETAKINNTVTIKSKTGSGQVAQTAGEAMDYDRMGDAVAEGIDRAGLKIECDDREVGRVIAEHSPA